MLGRNVLVKDLQGVETLGSVRGSNVSMFSYHTKVNVAYIACYR